MVWQSVLGTAACELSVKMIVFISYSVASVQATPLELYILLEFVMSENG